MDALRRVTAIATAVAVIVTGCGGGADGPAPAPQSPQDRGTVIEQLRAVDTCALFGDPDSVDGAPVTVSGPSSLLSCEAVMGGAAGDIDIRIGLNIAGPGAPDDPDWVERQTIDGVEVTSASLWDSPEAPPRDQVMSASCNVAALYPDDARLTVFVSAPTDVDGCAIGDTVIRTAMRQYAAQPQWADSRFPTTVLTGADPCAVTRRLDADRRVQVDTANSSLNACAFTIDGGDVVTVSFDYLDPALAQYSPDRFRISDREVAGDPAAGVYNMAVGPEFRVGQDTVAPHVSIVDPTGDIDRIRTIARAVAAEY